MKKVGVIGLGYVGLPLALEFAKQFHVVGFDVDSDKVRYLNTDSSKSKNLKFTNDHRFLVNCKIFVIAVPTPVDVHKTPDLSLLKQACEMLGTFIEAESLVVIESTVYPGATRKIAAQILCEKSQLVLHSDELDAETPSFYLGYSPERINPGDSERSLTTIDKVVSGSSSESLRRVRALYSAIIKANVVEASSIEIAEAAKVIENVQRDVNIALMNEFSLSFDALGLNTQEIFKVASTKWNFLKFTPGLVGGHCIGVDPYYFLYETGRVGLESPIIRSARLVNESMVTFVLRKIVGLQRELTATDSTICVLGVSFKKDCADIRNSKNVELCEALHSYGFHVFWYDPLVSTDLIIKGCHRIADLEKMRKIEGLVYAADHKDFDRNQIKAIDCKFFVDLQNSFPADATWSL